MREVNIIPIVNSTLGRPISVSDQLPQNIPTKAIKPSTGRTGKNGIRNCALAVAPEYRPAIKAMQRREKVANRAVPVITFSSVIEKKRHMGTDANPTISAAIHGVRSRSPTVARAAFRSIVQKPSRPLE